MIIEGGYLHSTGGNVLLDPGPSPDASNQYIINDVFCGTLSFGIDLAINMMVRSRYKSYTVECKWCNNLTGVDLVISGSHIPQPGETFTIVLNDGADAVTGTFTGLPQGGTITAFLGSDYPATISYIGGTGNDVVITVGSPHYIVTNSGGMLSITDVAGNGETMLIVPDGSNMRFIVLQEHISQRGAVTNLPLDIPIASIHFSNGKYGRGNDGIAIYPFTIPLPSLSISGGTGVTCSDG